MITKTQLVATVAPGTDMHALADALKAMSGVVSEIVTDDGKHSFCPLESFSISQDGTLKMTLQHVAD